MNYFISKLRVERLGEGSWRLLEDLGYDQNTPFSAEVIVPAGFVTDFASVPRLPLAYLLAGGVGDPAAVVHDYLYREIPHSVSRAQADEVFYQALLVCGVAKWRAYVMWAAVRCCGWTSYKGEVLWG